MTDHMQNAIAAFKEAWEQANQSQLKPEGYRTEAGLRADEPHIRAMIAQEILDQQTYITSTNGRIHDNALHLAARIAKGPQQ